MSGGVGAGGIQKSIAIRLAVTCSTCPYTLKLNGSALIPEVIGGVQFVDGVKEEAA